jgi:hypothetical protein
MPLVSRLKRFYEFSTELGMILLELLYGEMEIDVFKTVTNDNRVKSSLS